MQRFAQGGERLPEAGPRLRLTGFAPQQSDQTLAAHDAARRERQAGEDQPAFFCRKAQFGTRLPPGAEASKKREVKGVHGFNRTLAGKNSDQKYHF